jgi:hypothetical protein
MLCATSNLACHVSDCTKLVFTSNSVPSDRKHLLFILNRTPNVAMYVCMSPQYLCTEISIRFWFYDRKVHLEPFIYKRSAVFWGVMPCSLVELYSCF